MEWKHINTQTCLGERQQFGDVHLQCVWRTQGVSLSLWWLQPLDSLGWSKGFKWGKQSLSFSFYEQQQQLGREVVGLTSITPSQSCEVTQFASNSVVLLFSSLPPSPFSSRIVFLHICCCQASFVRFTTVTRQQET